MALFMYSPPPSLRMRLTRRPSCVSRRLTTRSSSGPAPSLKRRNVTKLNRLASSVMVATYRSPACVASPVEQRSMWRRSPGAVCRGEAVGKGGRVSLVVSQTGQGCCPDPGGMGGIPVTSSSRDSRRRLSMPKWPNRRCQRSAWTAPQKAAKDGNRCWGTAWGRLTAGAAWGAGPAGGLGAGRGRPRRYSPERPLLPTARVDWSMGQINLHSSPWNVKHVCPCCATLRSLRARVGTYMTRDMIRILSCPPSPDTRRCTVPSCVHVAREPFPKVMGSGSGSRRSGP